MYLSVCSGSSTSLKTGSSTSLEPVEPSPKQQQSPKRRFSLPSMPSLPSLPQRFSFRKRSATNSELVKPSADDLQHPVKSKPVKKEGGVTAPLPLVTVESLDLFSSFPDTEKIEKFLAKNPSNLFQDPSMGNIKVYFRDEVSQLIMLQLSKAAQDKPISRKDAFLVLFPYIVGDIVFSCDKNADDPKTQQRVETLISALVFLRNHIEEIWNYPVDGSSYLPPIVSLFQAMLNSDVSDWDTQVRDWIGKCETEEIFVKDAKLKEKSSLLSSITGGGSKKSKDVLAVTNLRDVYPNMLALESADRRSSSPSHEKLLFTTVIESLMEKSKTYCTRKQEEAPGVHDQSEAAAIEQAQPDEKGAFSIYNAIKFVDVMRRFSAQQMLDHDMRGKLLAWLSNGASTPATINISL